MPQYFRLGNPAVTSFAVDGVEHKVNADGLLEVTVVTPGLSGELRLRGAIPAEPPGSIQPARLAPTVGTSLVPVRVGIGTSLVPARPPALPPGPPSAPNRPPPAALLAPPRPPAPPPAANPEPAPDQPTDGADGTTIEEAERQLLFAKLDLALGKRIDRRRSLKQLQAMWTDAEASKAARAKGA